MNSNLLLIALLTPTLLTTGCETVKESTLLGIGIGSIVGSAVGAASSNDNSSKRALTGAAAGAAIGGLAGYLHKKENSVDGIPSPIGTGHSTDIPNMTMPKVRRVWVPDQIKGKKLVKGHFIYIIEKEGRWKVENKHN